jgi:vacuolar protein sorting-associated protein 13A/C
MGQTWLKSCNGGQYFSDDYVAHLSLTPSDAVVIVTYNRIVMLSTSQMRTEWEVRFSDLQTVAMERNGIGLILRGGVQGPFVPIPDVDSRRYLYKNIGTAVKAYNKKRQTFD